MNGWRHISRPWTVWRLLGLGILFAGFRRFPPALPKNPPAIHEQVEESAFARPAFGAPVGAAATLFLLGDGEPRWAAVIGSSTGAKNHHGEAGV